MIEVYESTMNFRVSYKQVNSWPDKYQLFTDLVPCVGKSFEAARRYDTCCRPKHAGNLVMTKEVENSRWSWEN
jgi:hypothetical protein